LGRWKKVPNKHGTENEQGREKKWNKSVESRQQNETGRQQYIRDR
jgi:hypothetical protein